MHRYFFTILTLLATMAINANAETSFDNWKTYMAYGDITDIEPAGNYVYVLSSGDLFSYNINDESLTTYDKVYPLTDCTISKIAWNNNVKKLIVIYDNYNIDLLDNKSNVINVSGYKEKSMTVDKDINNIVINGNLAYLCTAFGLVQIDMSMGQIRETFNIGKFVQNCAFVGNDIYVQTASGLFKGNKNDNLNDPASWKAATEQVSFNNPNDIAISYDNGYVQYTAYDKTNKCYWTNQSDNKLQAYTKAADGTVTVIKQDINPEAPKYNYFGYMKMNNGKLYACNGGLWDQNRPAALQIYNPADQSWKLLDNKGIGDKYGVNYKDLLCFDIDPKDEKRIMIGTQTGIYAFYDGKLVDHFNDENSPVNTTREVSAGDKNYQIVTSLFYDNNSDLWAMCYSPSGEGIFKYSSTNGWSIPNPAIDKNNIDVAKFMGYDSNNRIWIHNGFYKNPTIYCYSADLKNLYTYNNFTNEDGVSIYGIQSCNAMAEDKEGNIWIGTNVGVFTLPDDYQQDPSKGFYQIKVPRNDGTNYADYLLTGINVTTIAIDNANRKWIGTSDNGVYVISNDNYVQEAHFEESNSCLISNEIQNITIDKKTGIAYIGTSKGLCSVQGNASATNDEMNKDNVWAYPNPVRPDYTGLITVVGLSFNSDVKITTTNGVLVAQGRSTGGSFQWDGKDLKGKRVASGVYMVNTATENGESGTVCKIAIIN